MKRKLVLLVAVGAAAVLGAPATAGAQTLPTLPKNPVQACAWLEANAPDLYGFIATKPGGCVSTIASVGLEGLMEGALPSNAAVVGNCKALEEADFAAYTPEDGRPYPYQFYFYLPDLLTELEAAGLITEAQLAAGLGYYASVSDQLYAKNRAGCARVLELLHGGILNPIFALFPE